MRNRFIALTAFTLIALFGCTARNYYEGLRHRQEMDCYDLQGADRDACMRRAGMSYDEYQRQLKEQDQRK